MPIVSAARPWELLAQESAETRTQAPEKLGREISKNDEGKRRAHPRHGGRLSLFYGHTREGPQMPR